MKRGETGAMNLQEQAHQRSYQRLAGWVVTLKGATLFCAQQTARACEHVLENRRDSGAMDMA